MSQWKEPSRVALAAMTVAVVSLGVSVVTLACRAEPDERVEAVSRSSATPPASSTSLSIVSGQSATQASPGILVAAAPRVEVPLGSAAASGEVSPDSAAASGEVSPDSAAASGDVPPGSATAPGSLLVKRFVVSAAVRDREPVTSEAPLLADGNPIYAFAELVNGDSSEQQVTVRFERKGSSETVGNATLSVPAKVPRHRTWANTRFIREPGTWEAVLLTASGIELARTRFDVSAP